MDLDSALLRAFVTTAEERHFGRAAERLYLSQQALSKRIQRLEALLAVRLLDRTHQRVDITAAGERLLPHARRAVDAIDAAVAAAQVRQRALVVDVIDEHLAPLRLVDRAAERDPRLALDVTMRTTTPALATLRGGAADVAFGRAGALGPDWPEDLRRRPVLIERIGLLVAAGHRFARQDQVRLEELGAETLWFPLHGAPSDWTEYLPELAGRFGLRIDYSGTTRGFANFLKQALAKPTFFGMAMGPPPDPRVKVVPLAAPAPVFPWWVMWTRRVPTESIDRLTATMTAGLAGDLAFAADPRQAWLPDADRRYLLRDAAAHQLCGPHYMTWTLVRLRASAPRLLALWHAHCRGHAVGPASGRTTPPGTTSHAAGQPGRVHAGGQDTHHSARHPGRRRRARRGSWKPSTGRSEAFKINNLAAGRTLLTNGSAGAVASC